MRRLFFCVDGHTAGNPVRLVAGGGPFLNGRTMAEKRADFQARYDWIRRGLCFEPRGHDMMSGGFLLPPSTPEADLGILFIETSGCLPMCGHGTIGLITFGLETGMIEPRREGQLTVEVPAGLIELTYLKSNDWVEEVTIRNVASYLAADDLRVEVPGFGPLRVDVAYGGNYYAIVEPQGDYEGLDGLEARQIIDLSRRIRRAVQSVFEPVHPTEPTISGVSHVLWADRPKTEGADGRTVVFYGDGAVDRSPCGTGTSARMAQLFARGRLKVGQDFVSESYIGSRFRGRVEAETVLSGQPAILPSVTGSAVTTGYNTIWIDDRDPFWQGFSVT